MLTLGHPLLFFACFVFAFSFISLPRYDGHLNVFSFHFTQGLQAA